MKNMLEIKNFAQPLTSMAVCYKFQIFLCLFAYLLICLLPPRARALTMSNDNYSLQMDQAAKIRESLEQSVPIPRSVPDKIPTYIIQSGFPYNNSPFPFTFSISQTTIDFGKLIATNPVTRTNILTLTTNSSYGYSILALENHQMNNGGKAPVIPNTTCDNGTCSETTSATWNSNLTYGFGYRCDDLQGSNCSSDFPTIDYYKQFPDNSLDKTAQTIMSGMAAKNNQSQITYKINTSTAQPAVNYNNNLIYIAVPKY